MPTALPLIPLISSGVGLVSSLFGGAGASAGNRAAQDAQNQSLAAQQQLIQSLMSGITPDAYRAQAQQTGQLALGQLAADDASRGMLQSGAHSRVAASTLSGLYADANARYQQDRMNAIGVALGGQRSIGDQYAGRINPNPYAGVGSSLGAIGSSAAWLGDWLSGRSTGGIK